MRTAKNQTGVYVHVPFCVAKCGYCSFNSVALDDRSTLDRYLDAVAAEIKSRAAELAELELKTIYFGGGTPSLVTSEQLQSLIELVCAEAATGDPQEVTIEANPATLSAQNLTGFWRVGIDRLSIGVQSFNPQALEMLEATQREGHAVRAYKMARDAGFENIGLDLIVGLPEPFEDVFQDDLELVARLAPEHLSVYLLSIDEDANLHRLVETGDLELLDDDRQAYVFLQASEALREAGYEHYEVSNFAKPGYRSQHNSRYWTGESYHGFGAGAHSLLFAGGNWIRRANISDPGSYIAAGPGKRLIDFEEKLTPGMITREKFMLQLRLVEGIAPADFPDIADQIVVRLSPYTRAGLFAWDGSRFRPTPAGMLMADGIAADLWDLVKD